MLRALPRIPDHLKKAVEDLLTPVNIALFVGITVVLMSSGVGEVLGIGLLAFGFVAGGLDLCINVLKMVFDFYRKATRATTGHELDQAADLFAQIVLRGGMDMLDILVGRRAAAKLAGQGLRSVGAYLGYLEDEMKLWRARQAGGGAVSREVAVAQETVPATAKPKPVAKPKPGKLTAGSPEHKAQRWADYQQRTKGKGYDYDRWSKQYDTNMRNATHGLSREAAYREEMGGVSETVKTPLTNRQIDISIADQAYMGQLKTGKVSLTPQAKIDIAKDAALVKDGFEVEYILEKGASKPFLDALTKAGVKYKIGPQIPTNP